LPPPAVLADSAAVRIIAGKARGRRLSAPKGMDTRPTPDRVRESLFSILGGGLDGGAVLDLFAGTGALGLEALSRGATSAVFVEKARAALPVLEANRAAVGLGASEVLHLPAERALERLAARGQRFDLVFLDPPYALGLLEPILEKLVALDLLLPQATIVCEHHGRDPAPVGPSSLERGETRGFGDVALTFFTVPDRKHVVTVALYPGSFDPVTFGHLNIIERGLKVFDRLVVGIAVNVRKQPLFSPEERLEMLRETIGNDQRVEVTTFEGLLVDYARRRNVTAILRGLRAISDFEYEFQMAHMNRRLGPNIETVFMMTGEDHFYVSSQLVREIATFHGDFSGLVPEPVAARLRQRFPH
jgi:pantetheine-phosphate adenylyltransferase